MFAILVKSPNAAQAAVDMLLNIEKAAIIIKRPISIVNGPPAMTKRESEAVDSLIENLDSNANDIGLNSEVSKEIIDEVSQFKYSTIVGYDYILFCQLKSYLEQC